MVEQYAKFISIDKGLPIEICKRLAVVMLKTQDLPAIEKAVLWVKGDIARVYFTLWSQNNLSAITHLDKLYFDAKQNDFFIKYSFLGESYTDRLLQTKRLSFSGAKTKARFYDFLEVVKCLKKD